MSLLFETIRVYNSKALNLEYHQKRIKRTLRELFNIDKSFSLEPLINPPSKELFRCKVIYSDKSIESIDYFKYQINIPKSFTLIDSNISYPYKFLDRRELDNLFSQRGNLDEIIIIKDGYLSDTSKANIALFIDNRWLTPAKPLLLGTTRARFLDKGLLKEADLTILDLKRAKRLAIMNAMVGFISLDIGKIDTKKGVLRCI